MLNTQFDSLPQQLQVRSNELTKQVTNKMAEIYKEEAVIKRWWMVKDIVEPARTRLRHLNDELKQLEAELADIYYPLEVKQPDYSGL